jgi:phosphoglycolate phosphatase-like HAD superfamily hydrolase
MISREAYEPSAAPRSVKSPTTKLREIGMTLKHIVFDCDGVLWNGTNEGYFKCYHQAAVEEGIPLDVKTAQSRILTNWGQSAEIEVRGMIPEHPNLVPHVLDRYERLVRSALFLDTASLIPDADTTVRRLGRDFGASVITGMNADNLHQILDRFRLRGVFQHTISTSETDDPRKQKPTGYHLGRLLVAEGLTPDEVLCVGDAVSDVQMATRQRVPIVVVLTGHLTECQARQLGVCDVIPSVADLPAWLASNRASGQD